MLLVPSDVLASRKRDGRGRLHGGPRAERTPVQRHAQRVGRSGALLSRRTAQLLHSPLPGHRRRADDATQKDGRLGGNLEGRKGGGGLGRRGRRRERREQRRAHPAARSECARARLAYPKAEGERQGSSRLASAPVGAAEELERCRCSARGCVGRAA